MSVFFEPGGALSQAIPEYEPRPGQIRMANRVHAVLQKGGHLVVEAGTGTGKTCAYLIPAALSGKKVVISTGTKNLEEQIYFKDLPLLKKHLGIKVRTALMKGRRNYLCLRRWRRFMQAPMFDFAWEGRHLDLISKWVERTKTGDRSEIRGLPDNYRAWREMSCGSENCAGSKCQETAHCFINRMRREAQEADLVVVNHALFFSDLGIRDAAAGVGVLPRYDAIIFDEAHMIVDVATSHFGVEVSNIQIDDLIRDVERGLIRDKISVEAVDRAVLDLQAIARTFFDSLGGQTQGVRVRRERLSNGAAEAGAQLETSLRHLSSIIGDLKGDEDWTRLAERAAEIGFDTNFLIEQPSDEYVYWRERRERYSVFHASPIDLKPIFQEKLYPKVGPIVFTSATLSVAGSVEHFRNSMGLNGETGAEMVGTPFDLANQAILYVPRNMPDPNSPNYIEAVAETMGKLVKLTGGRAFLLFTSYRAMDEAYKRLASNMPAAVAVLKQGDAPKTEIIEKFKERPTVLFATHSFWQGVDVMGDALSLVVIDKLPFAVPTDPVVEARIEWINKHGGEAFDEYQLPHAILMLKQGLGRLLRHRNDRGILAVLDPRIHKKSYGAAVKASLSEFLLTESFSKVEYFAGNMGTNHSAPGKGGSHKAPAGSPAGKVPAQKNQPNY